MGTASATNIANIALTKIGAKRITSFSEDSPEARAVSAIYDEQLDEILEEHAWTFAQKRFALATLDITPAMTEDGCDIVYAKPSDFIKLNFVSVAGAKVKIESNGILSDTAGLKIIYTARITDTTKFSSQFVTAFATKLAAQLCFSISNNATASERLVEEYEKIRLPRAIAADSQQGSPVEMMQDEWEASRITGGASSIIGRTGDATWHPVW